MLLLLTLCLLARDVLLAAVVVQSGITQKTATLSEARYDLAATSLNELVFFGGGYNSTGASDRVDICNVTTGSWTTATLSIPRVKLGATSSGNLVFFGGGWDGTLDYNIVDIYNVSSGSWRTATLSQARDSLAATSVGNLVLFGGGWNGTTYFNIVDIYNLTSNTWTTATMSQARYDLAATSVANRFALFAGGSGDSGASNVVDFFDSLSGMWNTTALSQARWNLAAASIENLAFFGGGDINGSPYQTFNVVDIFNATSPTWNTATLSQARTWLAAASIGDIVAFGGGTPDGGATYSAVVDVYNATSNIWFTLNLSQSRYSLAATSSTNKIFFGGGYSNSGSGYSNVVDIFDIQLPPPQPTVPTSPLPSSFTTSSQSSPTSPFSNITNTLFPTSAPQYTLSSPTFNISLTANNTNSNTNNNTNSNTGSNTALLAGVLSSVAVLIIAAIVLSIVLLRRKRKNKKLRRTINAENMSVETRKRDTVILEPFANTLTLKEKNPVTLTTYHSATETLKRLSSGQILLNELEIGKEIGNGNYGRVCIGKWKQYRVALKFCQNKGMMDEFMREANLMMSLPPHPNVVRMYGVSIDSTQPIIVMEYCPGGSLDKLLYDTEEHISDEQKIRWVHEISMGMRHLHKHNIVHRDLAARNILLSQVNLADAQPKISDFGMSRVLQQDIEARTMNKIGPIRWMAPESIEQQVYSKKSDVWMFGILVYEIVAQCEPHINVQRDEVALLIRDHGLTPTIPNNCPKKLRELMQMCWTKQPEQRPNFEVISAILEQ